MKQLLSLSIWRFTGTEIGKMRETYYKRDWVFKHLPRYTLNDEGHIKYADHWLQFVDSGDDVYWLFDVMYLDPVLAEEVNNIGLDLMFPMTDWYPLFIYFKDGIKNGKLTPIKSDFEEFGKAMPTVHHVVANVEYFGNGEDTDAEFTVEGYLDKQMQFQSFADLSARYHMLNNSLKLK